MSRGFLEEERDEEQETEGRQEMTFAVVFCRAGARSKLYDFGVKRVFVPDRVVIRREGDEATKCVQLTLPRWFATREGLI